MASFVQAIGVHNKVSDVTSVTHIVATYINTDLLLNTERFPQQHVREGKGVRGGVLLSHYTY